MPETSPAGRVGYALNAFPYHTLAELWPVLEHDVLEIKRRCYPRESFPIELRFSEPIVRELQADRAAVAKLRDFFAAHDLALVTVNAFVLPRFHGERVKERVYLPAWHESDARKRFTCAALELLAQLAPRAGEFVSASVPFGALKPVTMAQVAPNILACGEQARQLHERTGRRCVVALEPEPGLTVETTEEVREFFSDHVPEALREYLGVNFDLSHQLVEFEDLPASVRAIREAGILLAKIHISCAAELTEWKPFYEDSIYLHQTTGADASGRRKFFSLDRPAQVPAGLAAYRVHYHLPVFPTELPSTLAHVESFLSHPGTRALGHSVPFIIETYTWPQQLRGRDRLVDNICREIEWVRGKI